jgi:predicted RNA binding protein YcfA (HicA-like mRNA interferase family)
MSRRLPRLTAAQVIRALQRDGWYDTGTGVGGHRKLRHPTKSGFVEVPFHRGRSIKPGTLQSIIRQAGLSREEFGRLI